MLQISLPKLETVSFLNYEGMLSNCLMTSCFLACLINLSCQRQVLRVGKSSKYLTDFFPLQGSTQSWHCAADEQGDLATKIQCFSSINLRLSFFGMANPLPLASSVPWLTHFRFSLSYHHLGVAKCTGLADKMLVEFCQERSGGPRQCLLFW